MDVTIERVGHPSDEIRELVVELDRAFAGPYRPEQHHALSFDQLFDDNVLFFQARLGGAVVGCGGVAFYAGFAEVKRMFTRPEARRQGVAMAVLHHRNRSQERGILDSPAGDWDSSARVPGALRARGLRTL